MRSPRLFVFLLLVACASVARAGQHFPIVALHDVVDFRGDLDDDAITVDNLIGFFEYLRANRWHPIWLDDVDAARRGKKALPEHAILITFDDGYRSAYTRVFPLLLSYRIPAVFALVGNWLDAPMDGTVRYGDREVPRRRFLSPEEICEMAQSDLVEFASHSYDLHESTLGNPQGNQFPAAYARRYTPGRGYENDAAFRGRITDDLNHSRELMTQLVGRAPRTIVWPFGRYNGVDIEIAKELGFQFALTLDPEPADVTKPMALARYHPTGDPKLADLVRNLQFDDPLPIATRLVGLDPAAIWTGDDAGTDERLGHVLERLRMLGATGVVIDAAIASSDGRITATWFPNSQLPVRSDLLSRIAWQCQTRTGAKVHVRLPSSAALRTLGDRRRVRELFRDLGIYVPASAMFVDDVPGLARTGGERPGNNTPWEIRDARRAFDPKSLPSTDALALDAFRAVAYWRPNMQLAVVIEPDGTPLPSSIADLTFQPIAPDARAVALAAKRMQTDNWLAVPASRRVGLWFTGELPPSAHALISATRRFQTLGGTAIGWASDDPLPDVPNAKIVAPTVSSSTFPEKF
ncbi:MAG: poly-beta-1,6-N-acetyl-D-glucosamine N-deacetylase PgaB [Chthoniobacterales bacterium]